MRLVFNGMMAMMLVGILATAVYYHRQSNRHHASFETVHDSLRLLHEQVAYQRAIAMANEDGAGYPETVKTEWFGRRVPFNPLVPAGHPWIDVAPVGDLSRHPPDPIILDGEQAGFWYNPSHGLFRARVMAQLSERQTVDMYNQANGAHQQTLANADDPQYPPQVVTDEDGNPVRLRAATVAVEPEADDESPTRPSLSQPKTEGDLDSESPARRTLQGKRSRAR